MVKAGEATDKTIASLTPHLDKGDILIDGGNTFFQDTIRRNKELSAQGFNFIGTGVSGGEEGALKGPSIMRADKRSLRTGCPDPETDRGTGRRRAVCDLYRC